MPFLGLVNFPPPQATLFTESEVNLVVHTHLMTTRNTDEREWSFLVLINRSFRPQGLSPTQNIKIAESSFFFPSTSHHGHLEMFYLVDVKMSGGVGKKTEILVFGVFCRNWNGRICWPGSSWGKAA
jgi:hypothetical protein